MIFSHYIKRYLCTKVKPFESIPGPKPLPLIGNLWRYLPYIGEYRLEHLDENARINYKKYGPIVREQIIGNHCIVHLFNPQDIETLFRKEGKNPERRSHRALLKYRTDRPELYDSGGLFAENGSKWYRLRKLFNKSLLDLKMINSYVCDFNSITDELINLIKLTRDEFNEVDDFMVYLFKWALENVSNLTLNNRLGCLNLNTPEDVHIIIKAAHKTNDAIVKTEFSNDSWKYIDTKPYKQLVEAQDQITSMVKKYAKKINPYRSGPSFLDSLSNNPGTTEKDVLAMIVDIFLAGIDTTAFSCALTVYNLANNLEIQKALRKDIRSKMDPSSDKINSEMLNSMHLLKACVKETMRLQPVSIGIGRVTVNDMIIGSYFIPKGTMIITQNQIACRQEEYFPESNSFIPQRWLSFEEAERLGLKKHQWQKPVPFAMLPFGFGPRLCIGKKLAEMETYVLVAKIINKFVLEYHHESISTITRLINITDKPLKLRFLDI